MATETLATADAGTVLTSGSYDPLYNPAPVSGAVDVTAQILPIYTQPVYSGVPGAPVPPATPTPAPGTVAAPQLPVDCDTCKAPKPPVQVAMPVGPVTGAPAPVLKAASACEICDQIKAWPWWVWLLIGMLILSLWDRR